MIVNADSVLVPATQFPMNGNVYSYGSVIDFSLGSGGSPSLGNLCLISGELLQHSGDSLLLSEHEWIGGLRVIDAGTAQTQEMDIGVAGGGGAECIVRNAGLLSVTTNLRVGVEPTGSLAPAHLLVESGGRLEGTALTLAAVRPATADVAAGGIVEVGSLIIGAANLASMTVTDSTVNVTGEMTLAQIGGAISTLTISGDHAIEVQGKVKVGVGDYALIDQGIDVDIAEKQGKFTARADFILGAGEFGQGTYRLKRSDAEILGEMRVGDLGYGSFDLTGGTMVVHGDLVLGNRSSVRGTVNLDESLTTITVLDARADMYVGREGSGTVTQKGSNVVIGGTLYLGFTTNSSGVYAVSRKGATNVSAKKEIIGDAGSGRFSHSGGFNIVTESIVIGAQAAGTGIYVLDSGGEVSTVALTIADSGSGSFYADGRVTSTGTMTIGKRQGMRDGSALTGLFIQTGGGLTAGSLVIGDEGIGTFEIRGGNAEVTSSLYLGKSQAAGNNTRSSGTLFLDDIEPRANPDPQYTVLKVAGSEIVGSFGTGTVTQVSRYHTVANTLKLGAEESGIGYFYLRKREPQGDPPDAQFSYITAATIYVGQKGQGFFFQEDNSTVVTDRLYIGADAAAYGRYELYPAALLSVHGSVDVGGGQVGAHGTGVFNQTGGTHSVLGDVNIARTGNAAGYYTLSSPPGGGAILLVGRDMYVGGSGEAAFSQYGQGAWTEISGLLRIGGDAGHDGVVDVNDGQLTTGDMRVTLNGSYLQHGGTVMAGDIFVDAHGKVVQHAGNLTADNVTVNAQGKFDQRGGITLVSDTMRVDDNSAIDVRGLLRGQNWIGGRPAVWEDGVWDFRKTQRAMLDVYEGGTIAASAGLELDETSVTNFGEILIQSGSFAMVNASSVVNAGVFDFECDSGASIVSGSFLNSGTLRKSAGSGVSLIDTGIAFSNPGGTIDVQTGTLRVANWLHVSSGQSMTKTGAGVLDLPGGLLVSGTVTTGAGQTVVGGAPFTLLSVGSTGALDVSGGELVSAWTEVAGTVLQSGGIHRSNGTFTLIDSSGGDALYRIEAGELQALNLSVGVGTAGGRFEQTGGTVSMISLRLIDGAWGSGTCTASYTMSGGTASASGSSWVAGSTGGAATLAVSGGTMVFNGALNIAPSGGSGTVNVSGGSVSVAGSTLNAGSINVSGGSVSLQNLSGSGSLAA